MSPGRQMGATPGGSNRMFTERPGDVGGTSSGRPAPGDQYLPGGQAL